jgi:hypothetical protein
LREQVMGMGPDRELSVELEASNQFLMNGFSWKASH